MPPKKPPVRGDTKQGSQFGQPLHLSHNQSPGLLKTSIGAMLVGGRVTTPKQCKDSRGRISEPMYAWDSPLLCDTEMRVACRSLLVIHRPPWCPLNIAFWVLFWGNRERGGWTPSSLANAASRLPTHSTIRHLEFKARTSDPRKNMKDTAASLKILNISMWFDKFGICYVNLVVWNSLAD